MIDATLPDTLVKNAYVITVDDDRRVFTDGYLAFRNGRICSVGAMRDCPAAAKEVIDARGGIVLPGMANAHNHLNQIIFRGYNDGRWPVLDIPRAVRDLLSLLYKIAGHLDEERSYAITRLHCIDLLKAGYTATHDEHFTNIQRRSVDGSWAALRDSGMRGFVARCILDTANVPDAAREDVDAGLAEVERLRSAFGSDRIEVVPGILNYQYLDDPEAMRRIGEGARRMGSRLDIDMTDNSRGANLRKRGFEGGQVDYYQRFDLLAEPLYAGKAVNLLPHEYRLLKTHDARVGLVPVLRFFDGVGLPIHHLRAEGILPGLGTDAPLVSDSQSIFETMRLAILAQNIAIKREVAAGMAAPEGDLYATSETMIEMATRGGARTLFMDNQTGALAPGMAADCVILAANTVGVAPGWNDRRAVGSLVWGGGSQLVDTIFVAGEKLLEGGRSTRFNEEEAVAAVEKIVHEISADAGLDELLPSRVPGRSFREWHYE